MKRSVTFTKLFIYFLTVAFIVLLVSAPFLATWYGDLSGKGSEGATVLTVIFYLCSPAAVVVILSSLKILKNLKEELFFNGQNVLLLSRMSYSCLGVVPACGAACFWFYGFMPITVAAFFMFLILRVVKNVFEYGWKLKEENDLTI